MYSPKQVEGGGTQNRVGHLGNDLRGGKDGRAVHLGRSFTVEDHSGHDVMRFNLGDDDCSAGLAVHEV